VFVEDEVDTRPKTEFMFEEFCAEWFEEETAARLLADRTLELLVVLATSYECCDELCWDSRREEGSLTPWLRELDNLELDTDVEVIIDPPCVVVAVDPL
jgi:hypothetical protein